MKTTLRTGLCLIALFCLPLSLLSQAKKSAYSLAMEAYNAKDYPAAATQFGIYLQQGRDNIASSQLYDGACIFALKGDTSAALELLRYLADKRFQSNVDHVSSDTDLQSLHALPEWPALLARMADNKRTLPERTKAQVRKALNKTKALLEKDNGRLWGENFWTEDILVLGRDNTIYALYPVPGSTTTDSVIYTRVISDNVLSQSNTAQEFEGRRHAIVLASYLTDSCATPIHELFHLHQYKKANFLGEPVPYLDQYEARVLLRLEYAALRLALEGARAGKGKKAVNAHVRDALVFRKVRQQQYAAFLDRELQIETLEGLANYTGYALSTWPDKYEKAIREINSREQAETYTRPFPYATGLAYGLLFDYLELPWRNGPWHAYNFLSIYETNLRTISTSDKHVQRARMRNNYAPIHAEELARKESNDRMIEFYTKTLVTQPVLRATLISGTSYAMSFNMNGTLALEGKGLVYSGITGTDASGKNFGNFKTIPGKDQLGTGGILISEDRAHITFPAPLSQEGRIVRGDCYEIVLAEGWKVVKVNDKGDLEIVPDK